MTLLARALAFLCGVAAGCAFLVMPGCAWRLDESASSGSVYEFRCPAPCGVPLTQGGSEGQPTPQDAGSLGGQATP